MYQNKIMEESESKIAKSRFNWNDIQNEKNHLIQKDLLQKISFPIRLENLIL